MRLGKISTVLLVATLGWSCTKNQTSQTSDGAATQLFKLEGKTYTKDDLPANIQNEIFEQEKQHKNRIDAIVNRFIIDKYVEVMAKKEGKTPEELQQSLLQTAEPSEKDLKAFYEANKARIPYPYDKVKEQLKSYMGQESNFKKQNDLVEKAKDYFKYESLLTLGKMKPVSIETGPYPTKGNQKADITVVEFADYQCPHCAHFHQELKAMFPKYESKMKFVFIDFPVNRSGISTKVSEGGYCAKEQGKYWEYHDLAFENSATLTMNSPTELAAQLKLDAAKFKACLDSKAPKDYVAAAKKEGEKAGVSGTPSIFINGVKVEGGEHGFEAAIKEATGT